PKLPRAKIFFLHLLTKLLTAQSGDHPTKTFSRLFLQPEQNAPQTSGVRLALSLEQNGSPGENIGFFTDKTRFRKAMKMFQQLLSALIRPGTLDAYEASA